MPNPAMTVLSRDGDQFKLPFARADVAKVAVSDVDLVLTLGDGRQIVLLAAALDAMSGHPPQLVFADGPVVPASALLSLVPTFGVGASESPLTAPMLSPLPGSEKGAPPQPAAAPQEAADRPEDPAMREAAPAAPDAAAQALQEAVRTPVTHDVAQPVPPPAHPHVVVPPAERPGSVPVFMGFGGTSEFRGVVLTNVTGIRTEAGTLWGSGGDARSGTDPGLEAQSAPETIRGTAGADVVHGDDPQRMGAGFAKVMTITLGNTKSVDSYAVTGLPSGFGFTEGTQDAAGVWHLPVPAPIALSNFDGTYALAGTLTYPSDLPLDSTGFAASLVFTIDVVVTDLKGASIHYTRSVTLILKDVDSPSDLLVSPQGTDYTLVLPARGLPNLIEAGAGDDTLYGGREPVLDRVDLRVPRGQRVGVVGRPGSGKSTLLRCVAGVQLPTSGQALVEGTRAGALSPDARASFLAYKPQEPVLLGPTLQDDLPAGGGERVSRALALTGLAGMLAQAELRRDQAVVAAGANLSGGQRQIVALARALAMDASIFVLDEPTAGVDAQTEAQLVDAVDTLTRGRTVLIATHSTALLQRMDHIVVLERGRIAAQGPRSQLLIETQTPAS